MSSRSIDFIGGGRVARILLAGFERAGASPETCVVSDTDTDVLDGLKSRFRGIKTVGDEVIDLVPVKPLEASEEEVREAYQTRLRGAG